MEMQTPIGCADDFDKENPWMVPYDRLDMTPVSITIKNSLGEEPSMERAILTKRIHEELQKAKSVENSPLLSGKRNIGAVTTELAKK